MNHETLYVIAVVSNPVRYNSRYLLYKKFAEKLKSVPNTQLLTVEMAFGERPFELTDVNYPYHVQVRSSHELWHKENLINIGLANLPPSAKYIAWIDADVEFTRPDWALETLHQLQHFDFVQMFQNAVDLGPSGEAFKTHTGFVYSFVHGASKPEFTKGYGSTWHPGYAWAARRESLDAVGGLYDVSILGSGDHLMAWALIGEAGDKLSSEMSRGYRDSLADWSMRCDRFIRRNIGYVPGTLLHHWHGKKRDRNYRTRWDILQRGQFDPYTDLKKDTQGLYQLDMDGSERLIRFRYEVQRYFRSRNEDSIDVE